MKLNSFQTIPPSTQSHLEKNNSTSEQPDAIEISIGFGIILKFTTSNSKTSLALKTINQNLEDS